MNPHIPTSELTNSANNPTFRPGGAYLYGTASLRSGPWLLARHCLSLAAVAVLTCGLGGAPSGHSAYAENSLGSANRITAVYRVDLAGFNLGDFRLTTVFRGDRL